MKRLKGPELKMPEMKVPDVVADLFYDLRDRRLLPLIALVLVAIVAVPFLLGGGSEKTMVPPSVPGVGASASQSAAEMAQLTVVESKPGLRDYRKRLAGRKPTDPFKQRYSGPVLKGSELTSQSATSTSSSTTESTSTTTTSTEVASPGGAPASTEEGSTGGGGGGSPQQATIFSFAIDVKISHTETDADGTTTMSEPTTRKRVFPTTPLPGDKAPVVTYMGLGKKPNHALLMVSNEVRSIYGDAECLSGTDTCQLLEVEETYPEIFVYGPSEVRYKINVLKVEAVPIGHT
jgi:hypothetical protein